MTRDLQPTAARSWELQELQEAARKRGCIETIAGARPMEDRTIRYYPPEGGEEFLSRHEPAAVRKLGIKLSLCS